MSETHKILIFHFKELIDRYSYFLLDAYGVFWGSGAIGMLSGAKEAMQWLVSRDKKVGILSNSTQLAFKEQEKLARHGVKEGTHYHFLLTSGEVTKDLLTSGELPFPTPKKKYGLFGPDHPRFSPQGALFQNSGYSQTKHIEEADFIYLSIPHMEGVDQENPEAFSAAIKEAAAKEVPFLCANPDRFAHEGSPPRLVVRQGMIAQMLQTHGAAVYFIGKPFSKVYEKALERFPGLVQPKEVLMVGDTPETDIRGGRQKGLATALVTKTGIMRERLAENAHAISLLPPEDKPDYAIESFGIDGL